MSFSKCNKCIWWNRLCFALAIIGLLMTFASCDSPSSVNDSAAAENSRIAELQLVNQSKSENKFADEHLTNEEKVEPNKTIKESSRVGYRLVSWTTIPDHTDADLVEKLTEFGCEFRTVAVSNGDENEIMYRCPKWKWRDFQIEKRILGWAGWLNRNQFETVVVNSSVMTHPHSVKYRLKVSRSVMLQAPETRDEIANALRVIGCEVQLTKTKNNSFNFSCPEWQTLYTSEHEQAHGWLNWLQESGFETVHTHGEEFGHTHEPGKRASGNSDD